MAKISRFPFHYSFWCRTYVRLCALVCRFFALLICQFKFVYLLSGEWRCNVSVRFDVTVRICITLDNSIKFIAIPRAIK